MLIRGSTKLHKITRIKLFYSISVWLMKIKERIIFFRVARYIPLRIIEKEKEKEKVKRLDFSDDKIWILWMQGEMNSPPLVQMCIKSVKLNAGGKEVIVLDSNNMKDYISLPDYIWDKYNTSKITNTHFSDIVRAYLLSEYGGYWIDATVFLTKPLIKNSSEFLTLKDSTINPLSVSRGQWTGYFMYCNKGNVLPALLYQSFMNYWRENDKLIDYFFIDYVIRYLSLKNDQVKKMINEAEINGDDRFLLNNIMNKSASEDSTQSIIRSYGVFKLSYKEKYISISNGRKTYYQMVLDNKFLTKIKR